ncbi:ASURF-like protein [Mya arenaria]|uniref:ASURF-like protein n=1 Tax=Mya arenaria TaxID=6604 RepID=A0ABY7DC44_MYAAR|nr:ASURF-like protein [Mya arenaria]
MVNWNIKVHEQKVLEQELKSIRKGADVYKQQRNSQIFFKTTKEKMMAECKHTMDDLIAEYKAAEEPKMDREDG